MSNDSLGSEDNKNKINELKKEYEILEKSFWVTVSFLLAVISYLLYNDWFLTVGVLLGVFFLGWRFLAKKPHTNNQRKI